MVVLPFPSSSRAAWQDGPIHPPRRPFRGWHAAPRRRKYNRFEFRGWHAAPRRRKYGQQGGVAGWAYPPTTPPCSWRLLFDVRRGGMDLSTCHAAYVRVSVDKTYDTLAFYTPAKIRANREREGCL